LWDRLFQLASTSLNDGFTPAHFIPARRVARTSRRSFRTLRRPAAEARMSCPLWLLTDQPLSTARAIRRKRTPMSNEFKLDEVLPDGRRIRRPHARGPEAAARGLRERSDTKPQRK
jgi:hypothetical protein